MNASLVVIDASALLDTVDRLHETWGETYRYLRGLHGFAAPESIASEAGNVVHGRRRAFYGRDVSTRAEVVETLLEGVERFLSDPASRGRTAELVDRFGITYYDAEYLELAARDDEAVFLTQDGALLEAAKRRLGTGRAMTLDEAAERIAAGEL